MDVAVTVPKSQWREWLAEGDLPGEEPKYVSHFWVASMPNIAPGERVYIISHGRLRGYAPLFDREHVCSLRSDRKCLMRRGDAVAVTIPRPIRGFQGWRYRTWRREEEIPFPNWQTEDVT